MKKISSKVFCNVLSNAVIVCLILMVFFVGFAYNGLSAVFVDNDVKAIYNGDKSKKNISLMVNVYWGNEYVADMLKTLEKYNVKATFFVGGCWVAKNEDTFLTIVESGQEIGSHGYFHKDHKKLDYNANYNEIAVTHKLVKELSGVEMNLFAPPSGSFNSTTLKVANDLNYKTIMWSKDTIDWRDKDEGLVYSRATKNLQNGDLILMHPTEHTAAALGKIIEYVLKSGFNIVTVGENIGIT